MVEQSPPCGAALRCKPVAQDPPEGRGCEPGLEKVRRLFADLAPPGLPCQRSRWWQGPPEGAGMAVLAAR
eukprot:11195828-Lingulodinium_polyedra.AAC.1